MKVDLTHQSFSWTFVLLLALMLILINNPIVDAINFNPGQYNMPLWDVIMSFTDAYPIAAKVISCIVILLTAIITTRVVTRNMIGVEKTYVAATIYIITGFGLGISARWLPIYVTALFLARSFEFITRSYSRTLDYGRLFNAGLYMGVASMIYAPVILFILLFIPSISILKTSPREIFIGIITFIAPFFVCSYVYWGMEYSILHIALLFGNSIKEKLHTQDFTTLMANPQLFILLALTIAITTLAIIKFIKNREKNRTRTHKIFMFFIYQLIITTIFIALFGRSFWFMPILAIPVSSIMPMYFNRSKGAIPNLLYILLIASLILVKVLII